MDAFWWVVAAIVVVAVVVGAIVAATSRSLARLSTAADAAQAALAAEVPGSDDAAARRAYNTAARELNARLVRFPGSMFARGMRLVPRDLVDGGPASSEPPKIEF